MDYSHLLVAATGLVGGGTFVSRVVPWAGRMWLRRADRKAKLEEKRISADSHVKAAEIAAEAQRDVAGITGQHQVLSEANEFIRELRLEREEDRRRLKDCEQKHEHANNRIDDLQRQINEWERTESARELTFQSVLKRAEDCESAREVDRRRLNALDQEMHELRNRFA